MPTDTVDISEVSGASFVPQSVREFILEFDSLDDEEREDANKLREWFVYHPQVMRDTWAMSRQALKALIDTASHEGEIPVNRVCLDEMLRQLHQDLAGDTPSMLEWLAIDSLMFSWLSYWCAHMPMSASATG